MIASAFPALLTWEEMMEMDVRLLSRFARLATRTQKEKLRDMAYAVRAGMNADERAFTKFVHDLMDETTKEQQAQDTWAELMWHKGAHFGGV